MKWFKLHAEARNDAKLRMLSADEFRVWFGLLCLASEQKERGTIPPMEPFLLAVEVAGGEEELLAATLRRLSSLRMVATGEDGSITFINFQKRQYEKPSDTPEAVKERVAKHRASTPAPVETLPSQDVTRGNAPETRGNAIDTDTDSEAEREAEAELVSQDAERVSEGVSASGGSALPSPGMVQEGKDPPKKLKPPHPDEVPKALLRAFRAVRYPSRPDFLEGEWREYRPALRASAKDGRTPDQWTAATTAALARWPMSSMVNPNSVARNLESLLEPEVIRPGANGNGSRASPPCVFDVPGEGERARTRYLADIPRESWPGLEERARKWLASEKRTDPLPDSLGDRMRRLWQKDRREAATAAAGERRIAA